MTGDSIMHMHKCGFGMGGFLSLLYGEPQSRGCGHVWEHPDKMPGVDKISDEPHFCPSCGKGPWCLQYHPRSCEVKGVPYETPTTIGTDKPEFQHQCYLAAKAGAFR